MSFNVAFNTAGNDTTVRKEAVNLEHRSESSSLALHSETHTAGVVEAGSTEVRILETLELVLLMLRERERVCVSSFYQC